MILRALIAILACWLESMEMLGIRPQPYENLR
jgi:hypothetical protein